MTRPDNPRFPHTCRIWRVKEVGPMDDQPVGHTPVANEEDPMADEFGMSGTTGGSSAKVEPALSVIYEGKCRAYDKNTTSDKGEVITSYRGLALPITRDGWKALGDVPKEGDRIAVNRGGYEEYGEVIDKNPANLGGTHLVWKYGRN